jgi:hypothetical protein
VRFAVEAWAPEYGASIEAPELEAAGSTVDASVEASLGQWEPVSPAPGTGVAPVVLFVDGVRRVDARVWVSDGETTRPGVCATVAAGVVRCDGAAEVVEADVQRSFFVRHDDAEDIVTRHGSYTLVPLDDDGPDAVNLAIHHRMTAVEQAVSQGLVASAIESALVVYDGPLRGRNHPGGVGYVKTQHVQYLDPAEQAVVGRLDDGQRTPLFLISGAGGDRFRRWSWYLRLPGPRVHPLAGVVRCEIAGTDTAADATRIADQVTATLPRFASAPHKDSRAPQNLYPIAGLEHRLRHLLADPALMERALRLASRG